METAYDRTIAYENPPNDRPKAKKGPDKGWGKLRPMPYENENVVRFV